MATQKVGEEAIEIILGFEDDLKGLFQNEAANDRCHYPIPLAAKGHARKDVEALLVARHKYTGDPYGCRHASFRWVCNGSISQTTSECV